MKLDLYEFILWEMVRVIGKSISEKRYNLELTWLAVQGKFKDFLFHLFRSRSFIWNITIGSSKRLKKNDDSSSHRRVYRKSMIRSMSDKIKSRWTRDKPRIYGDLRWKCL